MSDGLFACVAEARFGQNLSVMIWHVTDTAFRRLMAVGIAASRPQDAGEEDGHDDGYDDKWGSDIHVQSLDIQIIRG
jgi:hypothetical protein